jgi:uncharacterized membrane protein
VNKFLQVIVNVALYLFLIYLLYDSVWVDHDPWFAFVVAFVVILSVVIQLTPGLHAKGVSPGGYQHED